ncbi:UxaA family hydrolase [Salidesulfovibrio onnuriiensis]|uniref:UxaA family hydrolase n=1 Tax=Salidesulfovibrio onnuriiensis TaxID=2583823 RepID=UPI0011CB6325|nr:UxaA family hydrolase [Salidesulfovibrio onnuriiensis]
MPKAIVMTENDNVATALEALEQGVVVTLMDKKGNTLPSITVREDIPAGNKFALKDLEAGAPLIKYGNDCGTLTKAIPQGHFVHVHNVKSDRIDIPPHIITEILRQMDYTQGA